MTHTVARPAGDTDPEADRLDAERSGKGRVGLRVAGSMLAGAVTALVLVLLVFDGAVEPVITGWALLGFAFGWAMLAFTLRHTDQPQPWAWIPAISLAALGLASLVFRPSDSVMRAIGWVWPVLVVALAIWILLQAGRTLHNWSRRVVLYPVLALTVLAGVGGGYEKVSEMRDTSSPVMQGRLVNVGDHKMRISCVGTGSPTVVLEPGLGESGAMMAGWIQPAVAKSTRVCVYDRSGRDWSEPAPHAQDAIANAADLHTLLDRANVDGPYVLVGHSSGAAYIKVYAAQYPDQVAGMVLLDAQPSEAMTRLPDYPTDYAGLRKGMALAPSLARTGAMRIFYKTAAAGLPPEARDEVRRVWSSPRQYRSLRDELIALPKALTESQALTSIGDKPLIVLTAVKDAMTGWLQLQKEMTGLSTNSVQRILPDATHASLTEDKPQAAAASQAVVDVVQAARSGDPVSP
jgi:pimeloyl-ACP methyl ester carboxylesterase